MFTNFGRMAIGQLSSGTSILRQMTRQPDDRQPEQVPLSSARAMRLAMTRAADESMDMVVSVDDVSEQIIPLDDLVQGLAADSLILAMDRAGSAIGCFVMDPQMRSAVIEHQTTGSVLTQPSEDRPITGADMLLTSPLCGHFLTQGGLATRGSELHDWIDGVSVGRRFANPRAVGLALPDGGYRLLTLTIGLGGDRKGAVRLALPDIASGGVVADPGVQDNDWASAFEATVLKAPAALEAELTRMSLSIAQVTNLTVGQVFPLYGATVGSVQLRATDKSVVCKARLGQSTGKRAVRVSPNFGAAMSDLPPPPEIQETLVAEASA